MITRDRAVSFDITLRHLETDEPIDVRVHATIEGMDRYVGLMQEHVRVDRTEPDIDLDQFDGDDAINDAAFDADEEYSP